MADYTAGSVTAKIVLDTSEFKKAMQALKKDVAALKGEFNSIKGVNDFTKEIDKLKEKVESVTKANEDYRKQLQKLREENENLQKGVKNLNEEVDKGQKNLQNFLKEFSSASKKLQPFKKEVTEIEAALKKMTQFDKISMPTTMGKQYSNNWELSLSQIEHASKALDNFSTGFGDYWITRQSNLRNAMEAYVGSMRNVERETKKWLTTVKTTETGMSGYINMINTLGARWEAAGYKLNDWGRGAKSASTLINTLTSQWTKYAEVHGKAVNSSTQLNDYLLRMNGTFSQQQERMRSMTSGWNKLTESIVRSTDVLKTFNFALMEGIDNETRFYQRMVQLSSAMWKMNSQGIKDWTFNKDTGKWEKSAKDLTSGLSGGYSQYVSQATQVMEKLRQETIKLKIATGELGQAYQKNGINLNTYKSNMTGVTKELDRLAQSAQRVKNAQLQLQYFQRTDWLNHYKGNMNEINAQLEKQQANLKKTETNARQAGRGITTFNDGIVKTAHSGRILSNTLYQIRGALLSLKMIATAMGGMALWGFAMEIAEGVKTTFTAKNELEAQLKQNTKVGENGIRDFNKALDETISKFQKINKYQLGETVSSLGVEFNLGMRQMKKAMPIVAMIQSEYVRAGRTSEEAALAVKDILQGEFQRLSRETGVGKDELTKYGWSGDKTDIDSLLDAVKKAGEDRHWDIFAAKATSLNDVIQITKNRFEEFGADFLQSISPMIVSGFNTIIGWVDKLQNAFNSMGSFGRNSLLGGGFIAGVVAIGTALPMVTKGMGLAEIATLGWGKSLATAALNLNKAEVAQYGLRKAIAAVISGTKASELAERRATSAILGRVLGVNQAVQAEQGLMGALVHSRMSLKGVTLDAKAGSVVMGNLRQKLIYLAKDVIVADKEAATFGRTLKALVTSTRLWGLALKGVLAVGIVAWFASVATWADTVKQRIDTFNDYIDNGKDKIKAAKKTVEDYNTALGKMSSSDPNYAQTEANKKTAEGNLKSVEAAYKLSQEIKKNDEETRKANDLMHQRGLNAAYAENGLKNIEEQNQEYQQMKLAAYDMKKAEEERANFEYASLQHINEHTAQMKAAGIEEEKRIRYITEYSAKASEAAENLKKFNQGDLTAGVYYVINRLQLMWIDLWNDKNFLVFWESVKKTFNELKPSLIAIKDAILDLGNVALKFFSTDVGRYVGTIGLFGTAIGLVVGKISKWISGTNLTIEALKKLGGVLKERIADWIKYKKSKTEAEAPQLPSPTDTGKTGGGKGEETVKLGEQLKKDARNYVRAAAAIAAAMLLISEAIFLMNVPMGALAAAGMMFKWQESNIRAGIEGIKLIAPTVIALLVPVTALLVLFNQYGGQIISSKAWFSSFSKEFTMAAKIIAEGMLLVSEAIVLLVAPMMAIAALGWVKENLLGNSVEQGIEAINVMGDAVMALVPVVPIFVAAAILGAATIATEGIALGLVVGGIAAGMFGVAAAIVTLAEPMLAIAALGGIFHDTAAIQAGAEVIKLTAEALGYVEDAMSAMALIQWELFANTIGEVVNGLLGADITQLVSEDGFINKIKEFAEGFNKIEIPPIDPSKAQQLKTVAESLGTVNEALQAAKTAIENLPAEFKNGETNSLVTGYDSTTGQKVGDSTGYFDALLQPIKELKDFIDKFNSDEYALTAPLADRVAAIQQAATMLTSIKTAVDNVKVAMQGIGDAGWAANMAEGGLGAALGGFFEGLGGGGGGGNYSSSLGSSFQQMEDVISDIMTFNNRVGQITANTGEGGGGNVEALAGMVTAVEGAIQNLSSTLTNAVPELKANANAIGVGIHTGIKEGIGDLSSTVRDKVTQAADAAKPVAYTYGKGIGGKLTEGYKSELKIQEATQSEIDRTLTYLDSKKQEFHDKGYALGKAASDGYREGDDMHSPGIIARSTFQELAYVEDAFDQAIATMPAKAEELGASLAQNYSPQIATDIGLSDMTMYEAGLSNIATVASETDMQTTTAFNNMNLTASTTMQGMNLSVNKAFNNIKTGTTTSYAQITNTTRTSLKNMQDQTTKNIGAIRQSWRGMQTALIASAENIRSQTSEKIRNLESNMASFWRKIQDPANLLGASGSSSIGRHTSPRRYGHATPRRHVGRVMAAGAPKSTGISNNYRHKTSKISLGESKHLAEYLYCLINGGGCYAGHSGWSFDWVKDISDTFMKWDTHFGEIYDPYLKVGKFENDDFPVRGIKEIALNYIEDAISRTEYEHYYDQKYGSPLEAWNAGHFNCVDGARVAIALADAFGFGGGDILYTTWDGEGHGYAYIPGLGVIDATAIQGGYGLKAGKVNYAAGSHTIPRGNSKPSAKPTPTVTIGDIHVHIEGDVDDAKETGREIGDEINKRIFDVLKRSPNTGL